MRPPQKMLAGAERELRQLLDTTGSKADYRRVLCLWLRAALGLSASQVAMALDWHLGSVYNLQSRYLRDGAEALTGVGRGGRRRGLLTEEAEQKLLSAFASTAGQGGIAEVSVVRQTYEKQVGQAVAPSTVYRLLARHGWRKLVPRPYHPAARVDEQKAFKKSCAVWSAGKRIVNVDMV